MKKAHLYLLLAVVLALGVWTAVLPPLARGDEAKLPFTANDTIEDIRFKIQQNNYKFTVKENWITRLSPEQRAAMFRRKPSTEPRLARGAAGIGPLAEYLGETLPAAFDWRDQGGQSYVGPIRNQNPCESCAAFAAASAAETAYNLAHGLTDGNTVDFSEAFIVWCLGNLPEYLGHFGGDCAGLADYELLELEAVVQKGLISEAQYPYLGASTPACDSTHWSAPRVRGFRNWFRIPCGDINAIKSAILHFGAVDAGVLASSAFQAYSSDIFEEADTSDCPGQESPLDACYYTETNHLVTLVGWNDNGDAENNGYWILRNQWGTAWGESGYMRIKYRHARVACETAYLVYTAPGPDSLLQLLIPGQ